MIDNIDRAIINTLQEGFPITDEPFAQVAEQLDISTQQLFERLEKLLEQKTLSRFGPMYHAEKIGGALSLAAMAVPTEDFDRVAEIVNRFDEVAHNYAREHEFNMWFVLATETNERLVEVIDEIETATGYKVYNMPKQEEYFVNLRLSV